MWIVIKQKFNTKETSFRDDKKDGIEEEIMGSFDTLGKAVTYRKLLVASDTSNSYADYSGTWITLYIKEGCN